MEVTTAVKEQQEIPHSKLMAESQTPQGRLPAETIEKDIRQSGHDLQEFFRYRPSYHVLAPNGWLNDPCAPGYDPNTRLYHLSFQWNPNGNDWGDMSWGHATSSDLVSWEVSSKPSLRPCAPYDHCGVFTGCFKDTNVNGNCDGTLTCVYTSVSRLPIHYTLPYVNGSESLSLACSQDGGKTWEKNPQNPILSGPPSNVNVTGWRDPYITSWDSMQRERNDSSPSEFLYGFLCGGIVGETPTVFVYQIDSHDLQKWTYVGHLFDVGINFRPSRWSGDFGANWEVANVVTLTAKDGECRDFVIMGSEGCLPDNMKDTDNKPDSMQRRTLRAQLWMSGKLRPSNEHQSSQALANYKFAGIFDHGCYYAANSFWDPVSTQQIVYGWVTEEDLPDELRHRQGWSSFISLPRVIELLTLARVKKARHTNLASISSIETIPDGKGTYTIRTLAVSPDTRLAKLREKSHSLSLSNIKLGTFQAHNVGSEAKFPLDTSRWELSSVLSVGSNCSRVGLVIGHSVDFSSRTSLTWEPNSETFVIDRSKVNCDSRINTAPELAPHTLFTLMNDETSEESEEPLHIRAFYDTSVLEVFVNERTVITTRIYPSEGRCYGIKFFAESINAHSGNAVSAPAVLEQASLWDGLHV